MAFSLSKIHQVFPFIVKDDACLISYSQLGEDIIVFHVLANILKRECYDDGYYVDVGAYHPRKISNTKCLSILGWRGINIDAREEAVEIFRKERPNDINLCCGVSTNNEESHFFEFSDRGISTLSEKVADEWQKNGSTLLGRTTISVRSINSILEEHLPEGQQIDYMNIDLEGLDSDVVKSLDLSKYRPAVLTVELHEADILSLGCNPAVKHLTENDYTLISFNVVTCVFADNHM